MNFNSVFYNFELLLNEFNSNIFSLFKVDIHELLTNKFQVSVQDITASTTTIDSWFYWEYEYYIKLLNTKNKDEKDAQDKQDAQQGDTSSSTGNFNASKIMEQYKPSNFKSSIPRY